MIFLDNLINGLSLGSIYAIIALGYTMVYGIAKMLNFAHGDIIMVGSYVAFIAISSLGLPVPAGILISIAACLCLGVIIEKIAYRPLRNAGSPLAVLITAIGVSYFLQNGAMLVFGSNTKSFTSVIPKSIQSIMVGPFQIKGIAVVSIITSIVLVSVLKLFINRTKPGQAMLACSQDRAAASLMGISVITILTIVSCIIIMIALTTFTSKTKMGKAMRACSEDKGAAQLMGINVNATISLTFAIGSGLAAIAGVLLCSAYPTLVPTTGAMPGIKAFTAAVFGGIGSIPGALVGGILLGVIEIFAKAYISTQLSDAIVFAVLIIVLLFRPTGLLGKPIRETV